MKRKFTLLAFIALFLFVNPLQAQTTYASVSGGFWGATSPYIWETYGTGVAVGAQGTGTAATGVPSGSHNVYVRSGHVVFTGTPPSTNANRNAFNVTIESGGSLSVGNATSQNLRPGTGAGGSTGNVAVITNNGTLGGATDGLFVEAGVGAISLTFTGTGTTTLTRFRFVNANLNPASAVIFDQNVTFTLNDNYVFTTTATALANADNLTATINAGRTVTLTRGYWHNSGISAGAATNIGNYTYNINGTLDLSASTTIGSSTFAGSTDATKAVIVNINGTVKLPTSGLSALNLGEPGATGQQGTVTFNINNGGLLDGSLAPINSTTTTLARRYFRIAGTGQLKRTVGASDVLFDIGVGSAYNPVTINNAGVSDNFSVNVKNTIDNTPPTSNIVNKQWIINEDVATGTNANIKLGWTIADQAPGFNPAGGVFIYRYNGTSWEATPATVTGSGTTADPYVAMASGFTAFSPFIVGNSSTLPVSFLTNKAFTKGNGVQVEWTTAQESNLTNFVVEKSADGRTFAQAARISTNSNGNYSWLDAAANSGVNYYRIKSGEVVGSSKYTSIMKVSVGKKGAEMVIASNPIKGKMLNLQLSGMEKGTYVLNLFNNAGQQVYQKAILLEGSSLSQNIQLPEINNGVYTVRLQNSSTTLTKKIIVE